jgi:hypothetical protein
MASLGINAVMTMGGNSTTIAGQAMTALGGNLYRVSTLSRRSINPNIAVTVLDNASPIAASNIEWIDYLYGLVKLIDAYTPTGTITTNFQFYPRITIGSAHELSFSIEGNEVDQSTFGSAFRKKWKTIKHANGTLSLRSIGEDVVGSTTIRAIADAGLPRPMYLTIGSFEIGFWAILFTDNQGVTEEDIANSSYDWQTTGTAAAGKVTRPVSMP